MTLETLEDAEALTTHFLRVEPQWTQAVKSEWAANMCASASSALTHYCWQQGVRAEKVWLLLYGTTPEGELHPHERYPRCARNPHHCVVKADRFVIDLTARQYTPTLPFPFIWEAPSVRRSS